MRYFKEFLGRWSKNSRNSPEGIQNSTLKFVEKIQTSYDHKKHHDKSHLKALLLGQVQSGKTSQMLAAISSLADHEYKLFFLLTSDDTKLQQQTLERAYRFLPSEFNICDETDDLRFKVGNLTYPTVIVLKKNARVLRRWKRKLSSLENSKYHIAVIFDDEADAASLNTKVNQKDISTISKLLDEIGKIPNGSLYIQVTATPQSILLQTFESGWKPEIQHMFDPGPGYCGGAQFYGENSRCIKTVQENEKNILLETDEIPSGLKEATLSFLINCILLLDFRGKSVCNMLVHPGVRIEHHEISKAKLIKLLKAVNEEAQGGSALLRSSFFQAYEDIRGTASEVPSFEYFWEKLSKAAERIQIQILNSASPVEVNYEKGANVIIGGNGTGRGITFPALQIVYYCRESKSPLADTLWQHSRIFGYDRTIEGCRVFLPPRLLQIFRRLSESNDAMFKMLNERGLDQFVVLGLEGVQPTRKNILDQEALMLLIGDTDYYLEGVSDKKVAQLDAMLGDKDKEADILIEDALKILETFDAEEEVDKRELNTYINCLRKLKSAGEAACHLVVRLDRDIGKATGTLLSPNDRKIGREITDKTVLTLYRVNGQVEKGWNGKPLWIPNIKFPKGRFFYACE